MDTHDLIWWIAGLVPGLLLGWRLRARQRATAPPSVPVAPTSPSPPVSQPQSTPPVPVVADPPAPAPQAEVVLEATPAIEPPPEARAESSSTSPSAWSSEIQALFDQGDTVEAIMQIRSTLGGPVARKAAREHLRSGTFRLPVDVRKLVDDGRKLDAIRRLCDQTHMDMTIAQDLIEKYAARTR
ncbi:hypothetical protein ACFOLC_14040 [Lysobacter cavernae]|uniref:Uncharacterized protein n=1 Tax=Lysobacter cavernae TaxID=1685901 RepID=A0ABV7RU06_9GAMM